MADEIVLNETELETQLAGAIDSSASSVTGAPQAPAPEHVNKHTTAVVVLTILLLASLGFSGYAMLKSEPQKHDSELEKLTARLDKLEMEKASLQQEVGELTEEQQEVEQQKEALATELTEAKKTQQIFSTEKDSPFDHVKDSQVRVLKNKVEIDMKDVSWWTIADTNSMDPLIDIGTTALSIKPPLPSSIREGDVAFYDSKIANRPIVHRVVETSEDEQGRYYKFKGDNLKEIDPEDVRFPDILGVLVGIIY